MDTKYWYRARGISLGGLGIVSKFLHPVELEAYVRRMGLDEV
jgi:hypothetical protein